MSHRQIRLTPQQQRVLSLTAQGHGARVIAAMLGINFKSVKNHKQAIKQSIGLDPVATTEEMVQRARELELI